MGIPIYNLYIRRKKEKNGEIPNTYKYKITDEFKKRLVLFLVDICTKETRTRWGDTDDIKIVNALRKAFAVLHLGEIYGGHDAHPFDELQGIILSDEDDYILSATEYICRYFKRRYSDFISIINGFFQYERLGYKFIEEGDGFIVQIEDETFYDECTYKSLGVLCQRKFLKTQEYFISAYHKVASGDYEDALVDIGRSLETILKTRFSQAGIAYDEKDTLGKLLDIAQAHISSAHNFQYFKQVILDAGRARNTMGAHGSTPGQAPALDEVFVRFVINQAAANLLFLAEVEMTV